MKKRNIGLVLVLLAFSMPTIGGTISLAWPDTPGAAGYRLFVGTETRNYPVTLDLGNVTAHTLTVADNAEAFVAIKATNGTAESENYSREVAGWPKPTLSGEPAATCDSGTDPLECVLTISGSNFGPTTEAHFDNPGVVIVSTTVVSPTELALAVTIDQAAQGATVGMSVWHTWTVTPGTELPGDTWATSGLAATLAMVTTPIVLPSDVTDFRVP